MGAEIPNFFAIEGLDGVGKSTIIQGLRDKQFKVLRTPPDILSKFRPIFDSQNLEIRFMYYLTGVFYAGYQARTTRRDEVVFSDRYLLTTVAAHEAMGLDKSFLSYFIPIIKSIPKPECTFILTCEENERLRRMNKRGVNEVDLKNMAINNLISDGYNRWASKLGYELREIDTTNISPVQIVDNIVKNINA